MSDLVGNPNCWFSHAQAHIQMLVSTQHLSKILTEYGYLNLILLCPRNIFIFDLKESIEK